MKASEQIEKLSALARDAGLSYGEFVDRFGRDWPPPDKRREPARRRCWDCGEAYPAKMLRHGLCPDCRGVSGKLR